MKNYFILFLILFAFILSVNAQFKMDASGKIVVGDATANPIYRLELKNGDINTEANYGYRINESYILWNNGHPEDLFVGIDAGNSSLTQHYATCIGNLSGRAITSGKFNSFVGYGSGYNNTTGSYNTALGHCAMASNTTSGYNTMLGYVAGYLTTGSRNTYIGSFTGYNNTSGSYNTAIGSYAGYNNTSGNYNTALGVYAGQSNTTGINNTFFRLLCRASQYYRWIQYLCWLLCRTN